MNEALVWWVSAKKERLKLFIDKELADLYFIPEDERELMNWPEDKAEKVLKMILRGAVYGVLKGLDNYTCPWCYLHEDNCHLCGYGKRHGICYDSESRWKKIVRSIYREGFIPREDVFPPKFYGLLAMHISKYLGIKIL